METAPLCRNNDDVSCTDFCYFTPCSSANNVANVRDDDAYDFDSDENGVNDNTVGGLLTFIKIGGPTQKPTQDQQI